MIESLTACAPVTGAGNYAIATSPSCRASQCSPADDCLTMSAILADGLELTGSMRCRPSRVARYMTARSFKGPIAIEMLDALAASHGFGTRRCGDWSLLQLLAACEAQDGKRASGDHLVFKPQLSGGQRRGRAQPDGLQCHSLLLPLHLYFVLGCGAGTLPLSALRESVAKMQKVCIFRPGRTDLASSKQGRLDGFGLGPRMRGRLASEPSFR